MNDWQPPFMQSRREPSPLVAQGLTWEPLPLATDHAREPRPLVPVPPLTRTAPIRPSSARPASNRQVPAASPRRPQSASARAESPSPVIVSLTTPPLPERALEPRRSVRVLPGEQRLLWVKPPSLPLDLKTRSTQQQEVYRIMAFAAHALHDENNGLRKSAQQQRDAIDMQQVRVHYTYMHTRIYMHTWSSSRGTSSKFASVP